MSCYILESLACVFTLLLLSHFVLVLYLHSFYCSAFLLHVYNPLKRNITFASHISFSYFLLPTIKWFSCSISCNKTLTLFFILAKLLLILIWTFSYSCPVSWMLLITKLNQHDLWNPICKEFYFTPLSIIHLCVTISFLWHHLRVNITYFSTFYIRDFTSWLYVQPICFSKVYHMLNYKNFIEFHYIQLPITK